MADPIEKIKITYNYASQEMETADLLGKLEAILRAGLGKDEELVSGFVTDLLDKWVERTNLHPVS